MRNLHAIHGLPQLTDRQLVALGRLLSLNYVPRIRNNHVEFNGTFGWTTYDSFDLRMYNRLDLETWRQTAIQLLAQIEVVP